jgi:hypothetical protein
MQSSVTKKLELRNDDQRETGPPSRRRTLETIAGEKRLTEAALTEATLNKAAQHARTITPCQSSCLKTAGIKRGVLQVGPACAAATSGVAAAHSVWGTEKPKVTTPASQG